MPEVNGKKYPYTKKGIAAAKAARKGLENPGYGPNPADQPKVDDLGFKAEPYASRLMSPRAKQQKDASKARMSKELARQFAIQRMLEKFRETGRIPSSPTN